MFTRTTLFLALSVSTAFALSQENVSEELDAAPGGNLVVDVAFGTIDLSAGADDKVTIEAHRKIETTDEASEKKYLAEVPIVINKEGNTVTVRARRQEQKSWDWTCSTDDGRALHHPGSEEFQSRSENGWRNDRG